MTYIVHTRDRSVVFFREDFEDAVDLVHRLNTEARELGHAWIEYREVRGC